MLATFKKQREQKRRKKILTRILIILQSISLYTKNKKIHTIDLTFEGNWTNLQSFYYFFLSRLYTKCNVELSFTMPFGSCSSIFYPATQQVCSMVRHGPICLCETKEGGPNLCCEVAMQE